ncbi:hypothetical protein [Umezawaea sp. NPDC059074]|uniref:hypothetical protein n=1 Tax=Umezawaea sp. NPDC059074 TaxID=3346716 RepID=UPI00368A25C4
MGTWVYAVVFVVVLVGVGVLVDRRARRKRQGLERFADTTGRTKAEPVAQARVDHPGSAGVAERLEGPI